MITDVLNCQNQQIWPFENVRGYDFPIRNLLGHVSITKIRVHSLIDFGNQRRTTLPEQISTKTCRWVPLTLTSLLWLLPLKQLFFWMTVYLMRVVKGIFVTRDRLFFLSREMWNAGLIFPRQSCFHSSREAWFSKILFSVKREINV